MTVAELTDARLTPLGEVADFIRGITFTPEDKVAPYSPGSVVCMRTANVQADLDQSDLIAIPKEFVRREEQYLREGDLLVSTANSWNLVGKCSWVPKLKYIATAGGFISILRADQGKLDQRYLHYWFTSDAVQHEARLCGRQTTNISNLNFDRCLALTIPLPFPDDRRRSLSEQKRIAAILDKADAIRRKRREVIDFTNQLTTSLFQEMFRKWLKLPSSTMPRLGEPEIAEIASGVTKGRRFNSQPTVVVPYVRVANVQDGFLNLSEIKTIEALPSDVESLRLQHGDVLMTEGGDFDKLGRGAMWEADIPDCIHQNHVFRVRCKRSKLLPIYFANYIRTEIARAYFLRCAKKTSNLASMNMTQLKATPVACPPIRFQEEFVTRAEDRPNARSSDGSFRRFRTTVSLACEASIQGGTLMKVYFSDWFGINPLVIERYGAFNVSLINDLPLFIDPFLLFTSKRRIYRQLHEEIIKYLRFLRDQSVAGNVDDGLIRAWYTFPEVKQLWLGFSQRGNSGSGLGMDFARALHRNLNIIFNSFGNEQITKSSHLEKVCLVREGVGRDNISDFTANLIKNFLLEYTQTFCLKYIPANRRRTVSVANSYFDYTRRVWCPNSFELPFICRDYVLLCPRAILTKDENWISRHDLFNRFEEMVSAVPDDQLRSLVNQYLLRELRPKASNKKRDQAYQALLEKYPAIIEWYIKWKEDHGEQAVSDSMAKVSESETRFIQQFGELIRQLETQTKFYQHGTNTAEECKARIEFLKKEIEINGGYRLFYLKKKPIERESDLQILYRLTWFATPSDFNSEVNNGRGPVDFAISRGRKDKTIVEFKLAKNSKLKQNLEHQVKLYEETSNAKKSFKAIFYFTADELFGVQRILRELKLDSDQTIYLIDCRQDNKPSASNARKSK